MRLTVGSLPSAVYWRRRAMVLGVILGMFALTWASCSGSEEPTSSAAGKDKRIASLPATVTPTSLITGSPSAVVSVISEPATAAPDVPGNKPVANEGGGDQNCEDGELSLTPVPAIPSPQVGQEVQLVLKVKNLANRTCHRDLGADEQELYLLRDTTKIWSSDACDPLRGSSIRELVPEAEQAFTVRWDGLSTAGGCTGRTPPSAGDYQLLARLGTKVSAPVQLTLTAR